MLAKVRDALYLQTNIVVDIVWLSVIAIIVAIIAIARIRLSKGALKGRAAAYFAIAISLAWLGRIFGTWQLFKDARLGPAN